MNPNSEVLQIPIEDLVPNRFQPRISFDEKALNDLANSIKQHGIIQPLVVRRLKDKYEIIAGERRYKAAQIAGLISVPALLADVNDESSAEIALVENVQRKDLSSIEEAKSYKNILDKSDMTQEELAKKMGLSQSSVANKLRLLHLSDEVQQALLDGKISERHARSLLSLEDESLQNQLLKRIIEERLTVKQLDEEIKNIKNPVRDDVVDDVPLVDINENLELMKKEATDIEPQFEKANYDSPKQELEQPNDNSKFFKFNIPEEPSNEIKSNNPDIFSSPEEPSVERPPMMPGQTSYFDFGPKQIGDDFPTTPISSAEPAITTEPMVEEVLDIASSNNIDNNPASNYIETLELEPSVAIFENNSNSDESVDLPKIINEVRDLVQRLNVNKNIKISEIDTNNFYKIEISIEKDANSN